MITPLASLMRQRSYTALVVLTLALGIAAVTAVAALLDGVLLRPLPFPEAERLVLVREQNPQGDWNTSVVDFQAIAAQSTTLESVAAMRSGEMLVGDGAGAEWVSTRSVTADFFRVMGIQPARGRAFQAGEDARGAPRRVVLGHAFAARRFGAADPLGQSLNLDGVPHEIVGIMPPGTEDLPALRAEVWPALQLAPPTRRGPFFLSTVGRLAPGVTLEQARAELDTISQRIYPIWQQGFQDATARLVPRSLQTAVVRGTGEFLWLAFAAVLAVLLIALVNAANLALMRVAERGPDLAVRAALGASPGRLGRLLFAESLWLALLAGLVGVFAAGVLLELYRGLGPALPRLAEVGLDARVLGFAALLSLLCGLVLGALALLAGGLPAAPGALAARGVSAGRHQQRLRDGLVTLEFALALPLLVAAGLLVTSLTKLQRVDPGFEASEVLTLRARLHEAAHPDPAARAAFWARAVPELEAVPGVAAVALASAVPPNCGCYNNFDLVARPSGASEPPQSPFVFVSPGFFAALDLPLRGGRGFLASDTPDAPLVVVVTESWAARYFPGESPIGQRLIEGGNTDNPVTIVGVVADVRFDGLQQPGETVFVSNTQAGPDATGYLYVRTETGAPDAVSALRATLARLDPSLVPSEVARVDALLADATGAHRHWTVVIVGFAVAALLLAAIGVAGVLAYQVARRRREIGVRLALGADASGIERLVVVRGLSCAALGATLGAVLTVALTRGLESLLFGIERLDPVNLAGAVAVLLVIAAAASWLPARQAARVDPCEALRHE
jgi:putative ABC transport system permease protein